MSPNAMNTRMIKEALRYKLELGHSHEQTEVCVPRTRVAPAMATVLSGGAWLSGGGHRSGRSWDNRRCGFVGRLPVVRQQRLQVAVLQRG